MSMPKLKIALLLSYISIASSSAAIITPALPQIQGFFGLSGGAIEWVVSIFLLGYVFGQLIYGPLANYFGRLSALRIGLVINLFGILLCLLGAHFHTYAVFLAGRLATALGTAAGLACTFMLIHELLSEAEVKSALSFAIVSFTLGIGIAVTLGGMITEYWNWQGCFWILLLHGGLILWSTWQFPETLKQRQSLHLGQLLHSYRQVLGNSTLVTFSLVVGFSAIVSYCYSAIAPMIANDFLKLSPSQYGYWNLLNVLGMLASGLVSKILLKRYQPYLIIYGALAGISLCLIALLIINAADLRDPLWFFITTTGLYFFSGSFFPCGAFYATRTVLDKASGSSMMSFINMGSAMLSVILMGYLPVSQLPALIIMLGASLIGLMILLLINRLYHPNFYKNIV